MSFSVRFLEGPLEGSRVGHAHMYGEITVGHLREGFESYIGFWSPMDYIAQWRAGAKRAVLEQHDSCIITSITDPVRSEHLRWWLLYPNGEVIHVREALLRLKDLDVSFATSEPYRSIPRYARVTEDGFPIPYLEVPAQSVRDFIATANGA